MKGQLRKCVIHINVSLIYKVVKPNIELVTFIDNRSEYYSKNSEQPGIYLLSISSF